MVLAATVEPNRDDDNKEDVSGADVFVRLCVTDINCAASDAVGGGMLKSRSLLLLLLLFPIVVLMCSSARSLHLMISDIGGACRRGGGGNWNSTARCSCCCCTDAPTDDDGLEAVVLLEVAGENEYEFPGYWLLLYNNDGPADDADAAAELPVRATLPA
jgi:hypothetical protein